MFEFQRIKKIQDQISNIKYYEEFEKSCMGFSGGEGMELECWDLQDGSSYWWFLEQQQFYYILISVLVYQQFQQQLVVQFYGGYKEFVVLVFIQCSVLGGGGKWYCVVYDYSVVDEDEVFFQDGDIIVNVQQIDDGWMYGMVECIGDMGMLLVNYVEVI